MNIDVLTYGSLAMAAYLVWHYVYKKAMTEFYNGKLYKLRAELFLAAMDGVTQFDSDQYRYVETLFNKVIQYSNQIGFYTLFMNRVFRKKERTHSIEAHLKKITDEKERHLYIKLLNQAEKATGAYFMLNNPFTFILTVCGVTALTIVEAISERRVAKKKATSDYFNRQTYKTVGQELIEQADLVII